MLAYQAIRSGDFRRFQKDFRRFRRISRRRFRREGFEEKVSRRRFREEDFESRKFRREKISEEEKNSRTPSVIRLVRSTISPHIVIAWESRGSSYWRPSCWGSNYLTSVTELQLLDFSLDSSDRSRCSDRARSHLLDNEVST